MAGTNLENEELGNSEGVRIPTRIFKTPNDAVNFIVKHIVALIRERKMAGKSCVLGLPTGSTPVGVYRELVRLHKEEKLDFSNVYTFNLDEYYPMTPTQAQSYVRFMRENLFDHVNIPPKNIHIPDGTVPFDQIEDYCERYERKIREVGGIDLMLLGVGRTGHIAFNEPGSSMRSRTRLARLDTLSRKDAADAFSGQDNVPRHGLTMGIMSILESRKIMLMAFGEHKAEIVKRMLEGETSESCPASLLQRHEDSLVVLDAAASEDLTFVKTPWVVSQVDWDQELLRKAVIWLSLTTKKALLKLTANDFRDHELFGLVREHGSAQKLCRDVFDNLMATICHTPAGQEPKRVLCFSPHPDDDVISMGGTLIRLQQQENDVHIAYMTSGNVAVFDYDALRFLNFVADFNQLFELEGPKSTELEKRISDLIASKKPGQIDPDEVLAIKGLVRKIEAVAGARAINVPETNCHFLDLPFYRTGKRRKNPWSQEDVDIVYELLAKLQPAQIYVAGDLADPHGTHRVCAEVIFHAVNRYRETGRDLEVWMYRGAWQEWEPHQIERAVPMSPDDMETKKSAIFKHQSQKDRAMFPGYDSREFWQRAEERNRNTADLYDRLGLPEFFAMEGFVRWKGEMP